MSPIVVSVIAGLVGVVFLWLGIQNLRTGTAEESGARRVVNAAAGEDNTYTGSRAALQGWIRVGLGVAALIFAVVFAVTGG